MILELRHAEPLLAGARAALDDVHGVEHTGRGELPTEPMNVDVEAVRVAAEAAQELVLIEPALFAAGAALLGQAGWLTLRYLVVETYEREEYLLFSAFTDSGATLDHETCEKLFRCAAAVRRLMQSPSPRRYAWSSVWEGHATQAAPPAATATANRWIIGETAKARAEVDAALDEFRFDQAADALYKFVWGKVCDWYVEFAKPLFDGDQAAETRATMAWVLDQCMILLHPIMPFDRGTLGHHRLQHRRTLHALAEVRRIGEAPVVALHEDCVLALIDDGEAFHAQEEVVPAGVRVRRIAEGLGFGVGSGFTVTVTLAEA